MQSIQQSEPDPPIDRGHSRVVLDANYFARFDLCLGLRDENSTRYASWPSGYSFVRTTVRRVFRRGVVTNPRVSASPR